MNDEVPVINDANEITPEKSPEMYAELCGGCEEGEESDA